MKSVKKRSSRLSLFGALMFFVLIAMVIQIAVLVYDYIIKRTDDKATIALLMLGVIVILSVICTVCDLIRRQIMVDRPVEQILAATERIASGDFNVRLAVLHKYEQYNEYDLVMENLNLLAAELGKSEMLKSDFVSNISHEIKTPLAVIRSYAELLHDGDLDPETRTKYLDSLVSASDRLSALITNILKLTKLEKRELRAELATFSLTDSLTETILCYEELIESKGLELECDLDDVVVTSSESYLEIVWHNLISNAIKFTEPGGVISISLKTSGDRAVVRVRDTGCGISRDSGARIFEKFYQGDTSHATEGNGLGLALVKRVIDILGGEISVESEEGVGSEFAITLDGVMR